MEIRAEEAVISQRRELEGQLTGANGERDRKESNAQQLREEGFSE